MLELPRSGLLRGSVCTLLCEGERRTCERMRETPSCPAVNGNLGTRVMKRQRWVLLFSACEGVPPGRQTVTYVLAETRGIRGGSASSPFSGRRAVLTPADRSAFRLRKGAFAVRARACSHHEQPHCRTVRPCPFLPSIDLRLTVPRHVRVVVLILDNTLQVRAGRPKLRPATTLTSSSSS